MSKWISVKDRTPDERTREVLCACYPKTKYDRPFIAIGIYENEGDFWADPSFDYDLPSVTHWQPLPELPEVEDGS